MTENIHERSLSPELAAKERRLRDMIREAANSRENGKTVVGFSGGVDSSLLLWESVQSVGAERVIAVTATSPTSVPEGEEYARRFAAELNVHHLIVPTQECSDPDFSKNAPDRCYVCKRIRYIHIASLAETMGAAVVLDGTQADDDPGDRPGMRALLELEILSPLAGAGLGKDDIRTLLKAAGFHDLAELKAEPCLATRIPTGTPITEQALNTVRMGERLLKACGIGFVRLRHHGSWARIVTDRDGMALIANNHDVRRRLVNELKQLGFLFITLDMEEYGASR